VKCTKRMRWENDFHVWVILVTLNGIKFDVYCLMLTYMVKLEALFELVDELLKRWLMC
jgi:hypothetical protein